MKMVYDIKEVARVNDNTSRVLIGTVFHVSLQLQTDFTQLS